MVRLSVPLIFDMAYIDKLVAMNIAAKDTGCTISEVYGSLSEDCIGNLRPGYVIKNSSVHLLEAIIDKLHKSAISFNYVINSTIAPMPFDDDFLPNALGLLKQMIDIGVDSFTVTNSFIMKIIKENFSSIGVIVSICNELASIHEIREFEKMGADAIVLDRDVNRNFQQLRHIRNHTNVRLKLLCNSSCIYRCINVQYHAAYSSFLSNSFALNENGKVRKEQDELPYCSLYCKYKRLKSLVEYIKSPWIRPEDIKYYEKIGICDFKIDGRDKNAEFMLEVINAYLNQHFKGNLLYLTSSRYIRDLNNQDDVNKKWQLYIENEKMEGFIMPLFDEKIVCVGECDECNYCRKYEGMVLVNELWLNKTYKEIADKMYRSITQ